MSEALWRFLPFRALNAAENMAVDEAVFRLNRREGLPPTLRFYGWRPPAVSLGYFQKTSRELTSAPAGRRESTSCAVPPGERPFCTSTS
ncbi:MAG: hypothetical protein IPI61_13395 [Syntrophaceae bacterium]|nr:hypothetical protein [Syntrophaceae bacterium]